jgi:hypothetical protein
VVTGTGRNRHWELLGHLGSWNLERGTSSFLLYKRLRRESAFGDDSKPWREKKEIV